MRKISFVNILVIVVLLLLNASMANSQAHQANYEVYFKKGVTLFEENIASIRDNSIIRDHEKYEDKCYRYIQFYQLPSQKERRIIEEHGIQLLEYIPQNVYVASIPMTFDFSKFSAMQVRSLIEIPVEDKMDLRIQTGNYPDWAWEGDMIKVLLQYHSDLTLSSVQKELASLSIDVRISMEHVAMLLVRVNPAQLERLAAEPFIRYLDLESQPGEPESDDGRNLHRSNLIDADYFGGYDYDGTGVSVAINDDGYAGPHIDFKGRADQTDVANDYTGSHGDMTVGIVGAAGNLNPIMRGMAPGAFLWVRQYNSSLPNTAALHLSDSVMVFSSSYSNGCNAGYTSTTQLVDAEINDHPGLIQVFSAGNSNNNDCGYGAGTQWGNITGGHKIGKNVMATANLYNDDALAGSSSRGPASDGRIKPDIAAHGQGHWSTSPYNAYSAGGGTSAAAPGIAGVLAQLHQAYRDLNGGNNAPSALLKAAIMNTAYDMGNAGPDFKYGWGKVNAFRAMKTLEDVRYLSDTISSGNQNLHTLNVPANVKEMRVMVYWHDVEASTVAALALVNDLNMTITDLNSTLHYPLILDHTPNAITLDAPAVPGIDSINNVEQIRIANPSPGNHTIAISGAAVPQGPQEYYVVYEYIFDEIKVIYPNGGEGLIPGTTERIFWDAHGTNGSFLAEYTLDDGINWTTISGSIAGAARFVDFPVPSTVASAKVRISRLNIFDISDHAFSIITTPENIQIGSVCSGTNTISVAWDSVPQALSYDVYYLGDMYMDSVGTSSGFNHTFVVPSVTQDHWISVRARGAAGLVGRRAIAVHGNGSGCYLDCVSNDDAGILSLSSPTPIYEICTGSNIDVIVNLTNIGPNVQSGFPVHYQIDNNTVVTDTFVGNLQGGAVVQFIFNQTFWVTGPGAHSLKVWTGLANDGAHCNDTIETYFQVYNPISSFPFFEDFELNQFPPATMSMYNPDGSDTWEQATVPGSNGTSTKVARLNNRIYNSPGAEDYLMTLSFDLSATSYAQLEFDIAYSVYTSFYIDGLRVEISTDCGQTYTQIYFKDGDTLSTTASPSPWSWAPAGSGDWRRDAVNISAFTGNNVKIRFANINGFGNNLYLDNIEIIDNNQASYCIPTANCSIGDEIDYFSFNTIVQPATGCGPDGYSNFLAYSTILETGGIYPMSLSTNYSNQNISMWMDLNNDTIFDNVTERLLFDFNLPTTGAVYTTPVTIPVNANTGTHRMRVRAHWSTSCNDPCINFTYGETHDYTVIIVNPGSQIPVVSLGPDIVICDGNSVSIVANVSGGTPPYSYFWNTGANIPSIIASPGLPITYEVTVTDAYQNTGSDDVQVSVSPAPVVDLGPDQTIFQGSFGNLDAGIGFASYLWSTGEVTPSIFVDSAGTYSVTATDSTGCSASDDVVVTVLPVVSPNWSYTITSNNHTILIPNYANITIGNDSIQIGDYLGVFYDSLGTLVCGGYTVWHGNINSITAWGNDAGNDGFISGEEFKWKIWRVTTELEYDAVAVYNSGFASQEFYVANGLSGIESLSVVLTQSQTLNLIQGWDIISTYIDPDQPNLNMVFAPIVSQVIIVKNGGGSIYWPQWGLNSIGNMTIGDGYQIKMLSAQTLDIVGSVVTPELSPLVVAEGWSIIGYIRQSPAALEVCMSTISSNIIIMKNGAGAIYWPVWGINAIGNMIPGKGYQIKTSASSVLIYPANSLILALNNKQYLLPQNYQCGINTGSNMTLGIPMNAWSTAPDFGSEIGIFSEKGELVGSGVFQEEHMAISVWGADDLDPVTGLQALECFRIRQMNTDHSTSDISVSWDGNCAYEPNKILIANSVRSEQNLGIMAEVYPNPANQEITLDFTLPVNTNLNIEVYNSIGEVIAELVPGFYEAGKHNVLISTKQFSEGNYFIKLRSETTVLARRFNVIH
jgi:hypothetical protein